MSREDFIPIKHGTIETEDGKTVEVGGGWFIKEPPREMMELYKDFKPRHPFHSSDIRMALYNGHIYDAYFELNGDAIPEELREWFFR